MIRIQGQETILNILKKKQKNPTARKQIPERNETVLPLVYDYHANRLLLNLNYNDKKKKKNPVQALKHTNKDEGQGSRTRQLRGYYHHFYSLTCKNTIRQHTLTLKLGKYRVAKHYGRRHFLN